MEGLRAMHARSAAGAMPSVPLQRFSFGCGAQAASKQTHVCQYLRVTQVSTAASHVHPQRFLARRQPRRHRRLPSTACRTAAATVRDFGVADARYQWPRHASQHISPQPVSWIQAPFAATQQASLQAQRGQELPHEEHHDVGSVKMSAEVGGCCAHHFELALRSGA